MGVKGGLWALPGSEAPLDANSGCGLSKVLTWAVKRESIHGLGGGRKCSPMGEDFSTRCALKKG